MDNRGDITNSDKNKPLEVSQNLSKAQQKAEKISKLLEAIKELQPISIYDLVKVLKTPETTIRMMLVDLEHAGAVYSELKISKLNHSKRFFYTSKNHSFFKTDLITEPGAEASGHPNRHLKNSKEEKENDTITTS